MTQSRIYTAHIPHSHNIFFDEKELYRFLIVCKEQYHSCDPRHILSLSMKVQAIDLLGFLAAINNSNQVQFYWENFSEGDGLVAYGITKSLILQDPGPHLQRFTLSQNFLKTCFDNIIPLGDLHLPGAGPHLLGGFTFFPEITPYSPFPVATVFIPRVQLTRHQGNYILVFNIPTEELNQTKKIFQFIQSNIQKIVSNPNINYPLNKQPIITSNTSANFTSAVSSVLSSIENNHLNKVVISEAFDIISPQPFDVIHSLYNLRRNHRDCYVFSLSNEQGYNFLGASPERLISITEGQLITDALAGSAPRGQTPEEDEQLAYNLIRSEKEKHEHKVVKDFIMQKLFQLGLQPECSQLKILQLANIQHLWTPIYAAMQPGVNPLEVVAALHPTPAVAGIPTEIACREIRKHEKFDRSLYAAPLGWIDYQGNSKFIVGIRSALIRGNQARLYAGAGIVAGSDPHKEFTEVEWKLQSLLRALV